MTRPIGTRTRRWGPLFALAFVATTVACSALHRTNDGDAAADAAAAPPASTPPSATPDAGKVDASTSASAPKPKPTTSGSAAGKGNCYCLPDQGTTEHGDNQRMAPTWRPPTCKCDSSGSLCFEAIKTCKERGGSCNEAFSDLCRKQTGWKGAAGSKCQGWDSLGNHGEGRLSCTFDTGVDTYAGPVGRTCTGFLVSNKQVPGHVFCPMPR